MVSFSGASCFAGQKALHSIGSTSLESKSTFIQRQSHLYTPQRIYSSWSFLRSFLVVNQRCYLPPTRSGYSHQTHDCQFFDGRSRSSRNCPPCQLCLWGSGRSYLRRFYRWRERAKLPKRFWVKVQTSWWGKQKEITEGRLGIRAQQEKRSIRKTESLSSVINSNNQIIWLISMCLGFLFIWTQLPTTNCLGSSLLHFL